MPGFLDERSKPGDPIEARTFNDTRREIRRNRVRIRGASTSQGPGGTQYNVGGDEILTGRSVGVLTAAVESGTTITYGTGTVKIYVENSDGDGLELNQVQYDAVNQVPEECPDDVVVVMIATPSKLKVIAWACL